MTAKVLRVMAGVLFAFVFTACSKPKAEPQTRLLSWVDADSEMIFSIDTAKVLDSGVLANIERTNPKIAAEMKLAELKPAIKNIASHAVAFGGGDDVFVAFHSPSCDSLEKLLPKLEELLRQTDYTGPKPELGKVGGREAILVGDKGAVIRLDDNIFLVGESKPLEKFAGMKKPSERKSALLKDIQPRLVNPICCVFEKNDDGFSGVSAFTVSFGDAAGEDIDIEAELSMKDAAAASKLAGEIKMQSAILIGMLFQKDQDTAKMLFDGFKCDPMGAKVLISAKYSGKTITAMGKQLSGLANQAGSTLQLH